VRVYIWSYLLGGISSALWQLLEVTNHAVEGTFLSTAWGATNVFVIGTFVATVPNITLPQVGLAYLGTAIFYFVLTFGIAKKLKWLRPFQKGLFRSLSFKNTSAMKEILKEAIPLSLGSFLRSAEWTVLTLLASHLGPAEAAAWAILGSIWEIFYSVTSGIGDASEIRVAYHLGDNHPSMAKLSACKSLLLGMILACIISRLKIISPGGSHQTKPCKKCSQN
jgi:Na+-driven multidrug efflux pump